jgi:hypothetical protein
MGIDHLYLQVWFHILGPPLVDFLFGGPKKLEDLPSLFPDIGSVNYPYVQPRDPSAHHHIPISKTYLKSEVSVLYIHNVAYQLIKYDFQSTTSLAQYERPGSPFSQTLPCLNAGMI